MPKSATLILNTRPQPMGAAMEDSLRFNEFNSLFYPIIENQALNQVDDKILEQLNQPDTSWVFISKSSVQFFSLYIQKQSLIFAPKGEVIAVGETTKQALLELNPQLKVNTPPIANSESLLTMALFNHSNYVVLIKGEGGRGLITAELNKRNIQVIEMDLYRRQPVVYTQTEVVSWLECSLILATSVDISKAIIQNLQLHLNQDQKNNFLQSKHWIVLSERIKQFLIEQNVPNAKIHITARSDNHAILETIQQFTK